MKRKVVQLSRDIFQAKTEIENELLKGNKSNENLYNLITKAIEFLKSERTGAPISKKLQIFKYFEEKY